MYEDIISNSQLSISIKNGKKIWTSVLEAINMYSCYILEEDIILKNTNSVKYINKEPFDILINKTQNDIYFIKTNLPNFHNVFKTKKIYLNHTILKNPYFILFKC